MSHQRFPAIGTSIGASSHLVYGQRRTPRHVGIAPIYAASSSESSESETPPVLDTPASQQNSETPIAEVSPPCVRPIQVTLPETYYQSEPLIEKPPIPAGTQIGQTLNSDSQSSLESHHSRFLVGVVHFFLVLVQTFHRFRYILLISAFCVLYAFVLLWICSFNPHEGRTPQIEAQVKRLEALQQLNQRIKCPTCKECSKEDAPLFPIPMDAAHKSHQPLPMAQPQEEESEAAQKTIGLFSNPANVTDTVGTTYVIQGRGSDSPDHDYYKLCTFTNVCLTSDKILFKHQNQEQAAALKAEWMSKCWKVEHWLQPEICSCFHPSFLPEFLTPDELAMVEQSKVPTFKHTWAVHKWVSSHHIAHWSQKLIIWQSIYQHAPFIDLPPLDSLAFQDSDLPLSDHESVIFNSVLQSLKPRKSHPIATMNDADRASHILWGEHFREMEKQRNLGLANRAAPKPEHYTCFDRVSFTPHYGILSSCPDDTHSFREEVYKHFNLPKPSRCPPKRAVLLYRHNRQILNKMELIEMVKKEFKIDLEYVTIDETSTSQTQVALFASTGLLLSSHSSQMINVLFSPSGGSMIEISPEFYNVDFSEYAQGMGVFFQYAFGGSIPGGVPQPTQDACLQHLSQCDGAAHCIIEQRYLCQNQQYPNKNLNFMANLTAVSHAIRNSLTHLNWLCAGRWQ